MPAGKLHKIDQALEINLDDKLVKYINSEPLINYGCAYCKELLSVAAL